MLRATENCYGQEVLTPNPLHCNTSKEQTLEFDLTNHRPKLCTKDVRQRKSANNRRTTPTPNPPPSRCRLAVVHTCDRGTMPISLSCAFTFCRWGYMEVTTNKSYPDHVQAFAAGVAEGRIYRFPGGPNYIEIHKDNVIGNVSSLSPAR